MSSIFILALNRRRRLIAGAPPVPPPRAAFAEGSLGNGATDIGVRQGGLVLDLRLQSESWVAPASFDAQRQNIIDGIDSNTSIINGWDAVVKTSIDVADIVRISAQIVRIGPLAAFPSYSIPTFETITATIPDSALVGSGALVATPSFLIEVFTGALTPQTVFGDPSRNRESILPPLTIPDIIRQNVSERENSLPSPIFDFDIGEFVVTETGEVEIDSGIKALKNWIRKTLITERGKYPIYDYNYGSDVNEIIGRDSSYVSSRIRNIFIEALSRDSRISSISINRVISQDSVLIVELDITERITGKSIREAISLGG